MSKQTLLLILAFIGIAAGSKLFGDATSRCIKNCLSVPTQTSPAETNVIIVPGKVDMEDIDKGYGVLK